MRIIFLLLCVIMLGSCAQLKPYQKHYINDATMKMEGDAITQYEKNFQTYREAASGADNAKTGGGCGCN